MVEAPRQAVVSRVLIPLLAPGPFPRRVTLLYEPYPAEAAAAEVEREISNNPVRRSSAAAPAATRPNANATTRPDAPAGAREEAEGAGVGRFCLYVTTTIAADRRRATCSRRGRRRRATGRAWPSCGCAACDGAHAGGFAAALGLGLDPVELARRARR